jgi:hypothetical protein
MRALFPLFHSEKVKPFCVPFVSLDAFIVRTINTASRGSGIEYPYF